jgi:transposase-like protein
MQMAATYYPALYQPQAVESIAQGAAHLPEELAEDYRRMIYAPSRGAVEQARVAFLRKWKLRCKAISASFEETGDELFSFTAFPSSQLKALRTTKALERINEEFRRRTRTQASVPGEEAGMFLLIGLLSSGSSEAAPYGRLAGSDYSTNGGGVSNCIDNCSLVDC